MLRLVGRLMRGGIVVGDWMLGVMDMDMELGMRALLRAALVMLVLVVETAEQGEREVVVEVAAAAEEEEGEVVGMAVDEGLKGRHLPCSRMADGGTLRVWAVSLMNTK